MFFSFVLAQLSRTWTYAGVMQTTIHRMIENPIYGGAYAYGKTAVATGYDGARVEVKIRRKHAASGWR